jgi:hypothetical protein
MEKKFNNIIEILGLELVADANHYVGRTIDDGDITAWMLYNFSNHIKHLEPWGEQKQRTFNKMVMDLPTLNPSFFLFFALRLTDNTDKRWWWDKNQALKLWSGFFKQDLLNMPICETTERIKKEFQHLLMTK